MRKCGYSRGSKRKKATDSERAREHYIECYCSAAFGAVTGSVLISSLKPAKNKYV